MHPIKKLLIVKQPIESCKSFTLKVKGRKRYLILFGEAKKGEVPLRSIKSALWIAGAIELIQYHNFH
ncbi:hypothetical protein KY289_016548 [Solanum tuberosum]|nr:hypothetical protein KY289_016548 [Solanum tuberosum]